MQMSAVFFIAMCHRSEVKTETKSSSRGVNAMKKSGTRTQRIKKMTTEPHAITKSLPPSCML
jgi:hypothetical protein